MFVEAFSSIFILCCGEISSFHRTDCDCWVPLLICACLADKMQLPMGGPRSMLGAVLPVRNNVWLNAGPPAWILFSADNADIKFPMKLPITPETHEKIRLFDIDRQTCCDGVSDLDLFYQTQATQAMAAGYFGGDTAKMQDTGRLE